MFKKKIFKFVLPILILFIGCVEVSDDIDVTIDTAQNGMIRGLVLIPSVTNNTVIWNGVAGAEVSLENTAYSITTGTGGIYAIDGIPTGSYSVKATLYKYKSVSKPVVVMRQTTYTVEDLKLEPSILNNTICSYPQHNVKLHH